MRGAGPRTRRELNEQLGLALPEDADFDTIGGFVFSELGHIPVAGEELVWHNVRITVLEATRRRIERVRIEVLDGTPRRTVCAARAARCDSLQRSLRPRGPASLWGGALHAKAPICIGAPPP